MGADGRMRALAALVVLARVGAATVARADVTLTASRPEVLYSAEETPDCSALSQLADAQLPMNAVRLRAAVEGEVQGQVRYRWSMPAGMVGTLAADLNLGPADQIAAVRALCAEFGNSCVLTEEKLPFYNLPTILWLGPTCDAVPAKPIRNFPGGTATVRVKVTDGGRRKLGHAKATVGYGRMAAVTLYVDGRDGVGAVGGVPSDIAPLFGAIVDPKGSVLPAGDTFEFDSGNGGEQATSAGCTDFGRTFDACASMLYGEAGKFTPKVTRKFTDGSALCDNVGLRILSADIVPRLKVEATPGPADPYIPGDPVRGTVDLKVSLQNASPRQGGSGILLIGSGVLTCTTEVKIADTTGTSDTVFDLQHCSGTTEQPCTIDAACRPPFCPECDISEVCLTASHCSTTYTQACSHDSHCEPPACPTCEDDEHCVKVLGTPSIVVGIGDSVDLVHVPVAVQNAFPNTAKVTDTWTVNTFNAGSDTAELKYRVKGTREPIAPPP